jgi:hypothetical protein
MTHGEHAAPERTLIGANHLNTQSTLHSAEYFRNGPFRFFLQPRLADLLIGVAVFSVIRLSFNITFEAPFEWFLVYSSPHPIGCPGGNPSAGAGLKVSGFSRKRRI